VLIEGLVDEREDSLNLSFARIERRRKAVVGRQRAEGQDRPAAPAGDVRKDPLELARLVAAPGAPEGTVFLEPDLAFARQALDALEPPDGGGAPAERDVRQRGAKLRKAPVEKRLGRVAR
jgi:hypothetical protein